MLPSSFEKIPENCQTLGLSGKFSTNITTALCHVYVKLNTYIWNVSGAMILRLLNLMLQQSELIKAQQSPMFRGIGSKDLCNYAGEEMRVRTNDQGEIVEAHYNESGARVVRFEDYIMVRAGDQSFWLCDKRGRWFALD